MLESLNLKSLRKAEYHENLHVFFNSRHHITVSTNYHKTTTLLYDSTFRLLTSHYFHFHVTPHCIYMSTESRLVLDHRPSFLCNNYYFS